MAHDNSLKIEETFDDSKQSSFNSLQLSGNIAGDNTLDHSLDISLNFTSPTIQSSSKDSQFVDIFNPGNSADKINRQLDSRNTSDESSPAEDIGIGLQFELSQDFSQVFFPSTI